MTQRSKPKDSVVKIFVGPRRTGTTSIYNALTEIYSLPDVKEYLVKGFEAQKAEERLQVTDILFEPALFGDYNFLKWLSVCEQECAVVITSRDPRDRFKSDVRYHQKKGRLDAEKLCSCLRQSIDTDWIRELYATCKNRDFAVVTVDALSFSTVDSPKFLALFGLDSSLLLDRSNSVDDAYSATRLGATLHMLVPKRMRPKLRGIVLKLSLLKWMFVKSGSNADGVSEEFDSLTKFVTFPNQVCIYGVPVNSAAEESAI